MKLTDEGIREYVIRCGGDGVAVDLCLNVRDAVLKSAQEQIDYTIIEEQDVAAFIANGNYAKLREYYKSEVADAVKDLVDWLKTYTDESGKYIDVSVEALEARIKEQEKPV